MEYLQYINQQFKLLKEAGAVLNLVISGIPSILENNVNKITNNCVLNLVISGIPSIQGGFYVYSYYWVVLNLVISGIPSILT